MSDSVKDESKRDELIALAMQLKGPIFTFEIKDGRSVIACDMDRLDELSKRYGTVKKDE